MSVVEVARVTVHPARAEEFETVFAEAVDHVRGATGHEDSRLMKDVEQPGTYLFIVTWRELADHVEHFVGSEGFRAFNEAIGSFLTAPPAVNHVVPVEERVLN